MLHLNRFKIWCK